MADVVRTVEEISDGKRVLRDYDAQGALVRIRIVPLPKPAAVPAPERVKFWHRKEKPVREPPAAQAPAPPPPASPSPEPAIVPAPRPPPAPEPARVHARFAEEPALSRGIDVIVEPLAPPPPPPALPMLATVISPPEPEPAPAPIPAAAPAPEPIAPRPLPPPVYARFVDEPAPTSGIDVVLEELAPPAPAPTPAPLPFELPPADAYPVIVEREPEPIVFVEPEEAPRPRERDPAPIVASFEIVSIERIAPPGSAHEAEPAPEPIVLAPEPVHEPPRELEPETVVVLAPEPEAPPEPEPEPPTHYLPFVPDVDERVDQLLQRTDAPARRRKRAPIPAPVFAPLTREPWEERLDAALADR